MSWKEFWLGVPNEPAKPVIPEVRVDEEGNPSPYILPPSRDAYLPEVQPHEAKRIGTVYRSVNIISTMISQMELKVYRDGKQIKTPAVIANPIDEESQSSFVQQCVWSLSLWGNAYVRVYGDPVSSVEVLDPDTVVVSRDEETGKVQYWLNGKLQPKGRIRHLKFERMPGALSGHGPLQGCVGELRAAQALDKFQTKWFDTDGIPKGILTSQNNSNAQQTKQIVEAFEAFLKDHKNVLLPMGIKYELLAAKPIEVQYMEVAEANIRNIARIFGIPAANLLSAIDGTSMTYTNYEESNLQFLQNTLTRYMNEIEDFLSSLLPRSQRVQFDEEMLLRTSTEKLWNVKRTQVDIGYTSGDEMRQLEGKKPLPKPEPVEPKTINGDTNKDDNDNVRN